MEKVNVFETKMAMSLTESCFNMYITNVKFFFRCRLIILKICIFVVVEKKNTCNTILFNSQIVRSAKGLYKEQSQ